MNKEGKAYGKSYPDHDYPMVEPEARPLDPDAIAAWFSRPLDKACMP